MKIFQVVVIHDLNPPAMDEGDLLDFIYGSILEPRLAFTSREAAVLFIVADAQNYVKTSVEEIYASDETAPDDERDTTIVWSTFGVSDVPRAKLAHRPDVEWFALLHAIDLKN